MQRDRRRGRARERVDRTRRRAGGQRQRLLGADDAVPRRSANQRTAASPSWPISTRPSPTRSSAHVAEQRERRLPGSTSWRVDLAAGVARLGLAAGRARAQQRSDDADTAHAARDGHAATAPWHFLYFLPLPQDMDRCGRPWARSRRTVLPSSGAAAGRRWPARLGAAARLDRLARRGAARGRGRLRARPRRAAPACGTASRRRCGR